jgi:tetratricopeptide (TPR) repeat protein
MNCARIAFVLALLAGPAAADQVTVRAALHDGFARIAFDWPAPVAFDAQPGDLALTLHFKRPIEAPVERLQRELRGYIVAANLGDGGTTLSLRLARPVTVHSFTMHDKTIVVDLTPAAVKSEPRPTLAKPLPTKPAGAKPVKPAGPLDHQGNTVRLSDSAASDGAVRVTFEWARRVDYKFHLQGRVAHLVFHAVADIDVSVLATMLPGFAPTIERGKGMTTLAFAVPQGATLKAMRSGSAIVLEAGIPKRDPAPEPPPQAAAVPAQTAAVSSPVTEVASPVQDAPPLPPPDKVVVHFDAAAGDVSLRFDWPVATAAAVFRRGPALWVVFGTPTALDLTDLAAHGTAAFAALGQMPVPGGTALRIVTRIPLEPSVRRAGAAWVVDLKPQASTLDAPIAVEPHPAATRAKVTFRVHGAATPLRLADAEIGPLIVVPVSDVGRGLDKNIDVVDFRALPSVEGLVLEPLADDLDVAITDDGIDVTRPGGLTMSNDRDRLLGRSASGTPALLDFAAWAGPKHVDYVDERAKLEAAIVAVPEAARSVPRLALARFYFAHLFAAETLAVLEAIGHDDPQRLADPPVAVLQGAACLLISDLTCAASALGQRALDGQREATLWRASLASAMGDQEMAAKGFLDSASLLPLYPRVLRARFALEAARAMLETDRTSLAGPLLDLVLNDRATPGNRAMALYLDGRRLQQANRLDDALQRWEQAAASGDARARAEAVVARTAALLDAGRITPADAIKALDTQRYAWRGGHFEFALLHKLGELQLAQGNEDTALDTLHEAATYFPNEPAAKDVAKEVSDDFANLFLGDKGSDLPPLQALALYDEFHDLEPPGERYDAITKKLIDRLVAVDLLDRAAALLDDQVTRRLVGLDKAQGATQLAVLRLMDHQPELAKAALDIDVGQDLPSELIRQRQQLRARVLMELGKPADALNLISSDQSRDADRLRADIYWHGHDWKSAADTLARLAGAPPADGKIDADEGRVVIGLAAALTLDDDHAALARLRTAFGPTMANSRYAAAFRVLAGDNVSTDSADPESMAVQLAQVGALQNFMAMYGQPPSAGRPTAVR